MERVLLNGAWVQSEANQLCSSCDDGGDGYVQGLCRLAGAAVGAVRGRCE